MRIGYHSLWYFKKNAVKFAIGVILLYAYCKSGIRAQLEISAPMRIRASLGVTLLKQNLPSDFYQALRPDCFS